MKFNESKFRELLKHKSFLNEICYFEEIDSTNSYLLYRKKDIDRVIAIADYQTAGRGRYSRKWLSNPCENLMFTLGLSENLSNEILTRFSFLTPLTIAKAINDLYGIKSEIKFPNDLLIDGKKFCGILIESVFENFNKIRMVIGVGLNVNQTNFSNEIKDRSTSLRLVLNREIDREELLAKIIDFFYEGLQQLHYNFDLIYEEYLNHVFSLNKKIRIQIGTKVIEGYFRNVSKNGEIILDINGTEFSFPSGDITIVKE